MPFPLWAIPAAISAGSAIYGATRKPPQYEMSEPQKQYYKQLQDILAGRSKGFTQADIEREYGGFKERMLPEYSRIRSEQMEKFARRGIQGGPQIEFERKLGEAQIDDLIRARRQIESETRRLEESRKLSALQGMGQIGQAQTSAEFQQAMMEYQQQQQALADLMGMGGSLAYEMGFPQQDLYGQQAPISTRGWNQQWSNVPRMGVSR